MVAAIADTTLVTAKRGLDSRYMITHLQPKDFSVVSLTTIATPHRGAISPSKDFFRVVPLMCIGSAIADYAFEQIGC